MFYEDDCIFAKFPLDPCDHLRANENELTKLMTHKRSRYVLYQNGQAAMDINDLSKPYFLNHEIILDFSLTEKIFLGKDDDHAYFAVETPDQHALANHIQFLDLRLIAHNACEKGYSKTPSLLARGKMLLDWHNRHRFCANCGVKTYGHKGGYVRKCEGCGSEHFPRVDPVVIMMVTYKDKCLLGRGPHFRKGVYSALAGFMEPGETIEEAVRREVLEEAGIEIGDVQYVKSQPWPFPSSLMIGVVGCAINDDICLDDELEDAQWFSKQQISKVISSGGDDQFRLPPKLAIARHLLEFWLYSD